MKSRESRKRGPRQRQHDMAATWYTISEFRSMYRLSYSLFAALKSAGRAPEITRCAGLKIITHGAIAEWHRTESARIAAEMNVPIQIPPPEVKASGE